MSLINLHKIGSSKFFLTQLALFRTEWGGGGGGGQKGPLSVFPL